MSVPVCGLCVPPLDCPMNPIKEPAATPAKSMGYGFRAVLVLSRLSRMLAWSLRLPVLASAGRWAWAVPRY